MAKTIGPLFSEDAHGSISKLLSYSHKKSGKQVRLYNKPAKVATAKQRGQRRVTEFLVAQWQNMSAPNKATWATNAAASGLNIAGYHYFLREAQRDLYTHHGLVGYWHCNDIVNGKVLDISGNANHGILRLNYPADAPTLTPSMSTRFNNGLLLNGTSAFVDCQNGKSLNLSSAFSTEQWTRPAIHPENSYAGYVTKGNAYIISHHATGTHFSINLRIGGAYKLWITAIPNLQAGKWYCLVFTYTSGNLNVYINGILFDSTDTIEGVLDTSAEVLRLGSDRTIAGRWYSGVFDEMCLYKRQFSAAEIATRYKFATRKVS